MGPVTRLFIILLSCIVANSYGHAQTNKKSARRGDVSGQAITAADSFTIRVVADKLSDPWELCYGPDSALWVTESKGYRVLRVSLRDNRRQVLLDLSSERRFPRYDKINDSIDGGKPWPQSGLMGMALHPGLRSGVPFVYLAYHSSFNGAGEQGKGCLDNQGGCFFYTRIVRYTYDASTQQLASPMIIADSLPGSNDHNGGRLLIAPVGSRSYLFYSIGDMGAGQFDNAGRANHAQDPGVYEGKILRFNLEPDSVAHPAIYGGGWTPRDNPFGTAVYTMGHRNPQGLAYAMIAGRQHIFSCEHGPFSDDEINLVDKGRNYGHPLVIGYADGNYNGLAAGVTSHANLPGTWHTSYPLITDEKAAARKMGSSYTDPLYSFFPTSNKDLAAVLLKQKNDKGGEWKAEAPSSLDVYTSDAIPGWKNSLLVTTLKGGKLIRLPLDSTGTRISGKPVYYFKGPVRYRDLAISPDGLKIYVALDSTTVSSGPSEENPEAIAYRGVILECTYVPRKPSGGAASGNESTPVLPAPVISSTGTRHSRND